jgi:hypothetical protein
VLFNYSTENGKGDDVDEKEKEDLEFEEQSSFSSSKEFECKDLLVKEIELLFENNWLFTDIEKMIPKFYRENKMRINHLHGEVTS